MTDEYNYDLTEAERPVLATVRNLSGGLPTDESGYVRIADPTTGVGLFTSNTNPAVSGLEITGGTALLGSDVGFSVLIREYLNSKVYNGALTAGPPEPDQPIGADNPLPYWNFVQESGNAFTARWAVSAAGVGFVTFSMASGAAGDKAYLEQYVQISANTSSQWTHEVFPFGTGDGSVTDAFAAAQFLDAGGTVTGTGATATSLTSISTPLYPDTDGINANGFYLRLRIGAQRNSGAGATTTGSAIIQGGVVKAVPEPLTSTWTPTVTFSTPGDLSVSYSTQTAWYRKQGSVVTVGGRVTTSTFTYTTASGQLRLGGLPFTAANVTNPGAGPAAIGGFTSATNAWTIAMVNAAQTFATFFISTSGGGLSQMATTTVPTGGTVDIIFGFSYIIA